MTGWGSPHGTVTPRGRGGPQSYAGFHETCRSLSYTEDGGTRRDRVRLPPAPVLEPEHSEPTVVGAGTQEEAGPEPETEGGPTRRGHTVVDTRPDVQG